MGPPRHGRARPHRPEVSIEPSRAIADVSSISGYFHVHTGPADDGAWRTLGRFLTDGPAFAGQVARTATRLGTSEPRVAASILHLGLAARLWSPVLGVAVLHRTLLDWTPRTLQCAATRDGPLPLRLTAPAADPIADLGTVAEPLYRSVAALLEPLADLVHGTVKIAPRLLWGNAASALAGSVCALARARPAHAADVVGVGNALLGTGHLRNTGHLAEAAPGQPYFTRTTCCLYYRVPGGGMCGDCVLLTPTLKGTP